MNGKHTIFDTRRTVLSDTRDISPTPERPDIDSLHSSFLAERGMPSPGAQPAPAFKRTA